MMATSKHEGTALMLSKESESVIQSLESVKGLLTQHVLNAEKLPVEYY